MPSSSTPTGAPQIAIIEGPSKTVTFGSNQVLDKSVDNINGPDGEPPSRPDPDVPDEDVPDEEPSPPDNDVPNALPTHDQTIVIKDASKSVVLRKPKSSLQMTFLRKKRTTISKP
jgi:hypothetical protein